MITVFMLLAPIACTTQRHDQNDQAAGDQIVRLSVIQFAGIAGDTALAAATLGLYWGVWEIRPIFVDGKHLGALDNWVEVSPGVHRVAAAASQGMIGPFGLDARWSCFGFVDYDFPPGSFHLSFNRDRRNPFFHITDVRKGKVVASGKCSSGDAKGAPEKPE